MKRAFLQFLTREEIVPLFRPFQLGAATIFMLHRFADPAFGNRGHSADALRANLSFLRRHRFKLIGLPELLDELEENRLGSTPAVVFTVDDGYADFARVAAPVFAEFDCPVTVFVTTGFVDGGLWMWWDKIIWAFAKSRRTSISIQIGQSSCHYALNNSEARWRGAHDLIEKLKRVSDPILQAVINDLLQLAAVELPQELPDMFRPLTWGDVAQCASHGVTFGPHTVTHPILSQVNDDRARREIEDSWERLQSATTAAIPVFCYPNGDYPSFSDRERRSVLSIGMRATVLAEQHFTSTRNRSVTTRPSTIELPRFAYTEDAPQFRQIVGGMQRFKQSVRHALTPTFGR
jgi:peptidoglycan/xylan/chitin deacetylase (PgdA/CDA1 family)